MKKYEKYKDSGIEWLGIIPNYWRTKRLKDISNIVRGGSPRPAGDPRYYEGDIPFLKVGDLTSNENVYVNDYSFTITPEGLTHTRYVKADTLLMTNSGATLGIPKICSFPTTFNDGIAAFLNVKSDDKRYLYYVLKSRTQWFLNLASMGQGQPNLNTEIIGCTFWAFPLPEEQIAIANYLDLKTQLIDRKIELLNNKISYYKELRRSLINKVICRGLDDSVKLKDSGIDWIGEIPEHWEVKRFKSFAKTLKGKNLEYHDSYFEKSLPNLSLEYLRNNTSDTIDYCFSPDKNLIANEQDLIIIWDGAGVGEILKAKKGYISSTIAKLQFTKKCDSRFFYFFKDSLEYTLKSIPTGMGIPHLNPVILNNYKFPIPPKEEQERIADYLEGKTQTIEDVVKNIQNQISKLQELRKTLINDVVTGKIKVTE